MPLSDNWLVIGIAGGTCSGKSTLAQSLQQHLRDAASSEQLPWLQGGEVRIIKQDDYFYKRDRPEHTWIPVWNYINREIMGALDMDRMCADIERVILTDGAQRSSQFTRNVLIIEGFLIFNHAKVRDFCRLRFDVRISYEECKRRRSHRQYNPPNPPGYFEEFIWPLYLKHLADYEAIMETGLYTLDGERRTSVLVDIATERIRAFVEGSVHSDHDGE